jgi:hypothetical protein
MKRLCLIAIAALTCAGAAHADEDAAPFKLTLGAYHLSGGGAPSGNALDVNLRHTSDLGNVWVGYYRSPSEDVSQARIGWDRTFAWGPVRVMPSVQAASGGFWGGSIGVETGETWFVGAGLGRTNLRPYANLNFDPNDAWTLAGGYRWADNHALALLLVRDNREHPDQQHLHLSYRTPIEGGQRLTLDLLDKRGLVNGEPIHRVGASLGYDWPRHFVRVAWDPKVNFTAQNMLRLSAGLRF